MLKTCKVIIFVILLCGMTSLSNASTPDMSLVFKNGLLGSLYGAALIGGANTVVILTSDNTESNMYRVKYGFAIGTILGLIYGTTMGLLGEPLLPSFSETSSPTETSTKAKLKNKTYYALCHLKIFKDHGKTGYYTQIFNLTF